MVGERRPPLVVDLGSGTGLSTRFWADAADRVVGIEPNDDMRSQASAATTDSSVEYRPGSASDTKLPAESATIVTCAQSLHWMEPASTFAEVARILKPGGVFAACDYDWPPTTGVWQADKAYTDCMSGLHRLDEEVSRQRDVRRWSKERHLARMAESGRFSFVKEIVLHHTDEGTAGRLVGLLMSQGGVRMLLAAGHSEQELGIAAFRARCLELLGDRPRVWYWSSRVRIGVK